MLKITQVKDNHDTVLRLEGKLIGEWVDELRSLGQGLLAKNTKLIIDLAQVSFVDAAGAQLLKEFICANCQVVNCSGFLTELLKVDCHKLQ